MRKPFIKPSSEQIVRWIESNIHNYKVRKSNKRGPIYLIDNPAIAGDSGQHIGISPDEGWVHDFRPHMVTYNGSFLRFVTKVKNISFSEAVKSVCGTSANVRILMSEAKKRLNQEEEEAEDIPTTQPIALPDGLVPIDQNQYSKAFGIAMGYLRSRCVLMSEAVRLRVHYNATMVCFPYIEYGELVYWQARYILNKQYLFPTDAGGKSAEDFLHGFDFVEPHTDIILVESIFNAIVLNEGALATGGATLKLNQFKRIRSVLEPSRIILAPDNDKAGKASLLQNYKTLDQAFKNKIYYVLPPSPYKDWNEMAQSLHRNESPGIVREYVDKHAKPLDMPALMKLTLSL